MKAGIEPGLPEGLPAEQRVILTHSVREGHGCLIKYLRAKIIGLLHGEYQTLAAILIAPKYAVALIPAGEPDDFYREFVFITQEICLSVVAAVTGTELQILLESIIAYCESFLGKHDFEDLE